MKYDELLKSVGEFGKIQKIQTFIVGMVAILSACHALSIAFVSATPKHHCKLPDTPPTEANSSMDLSGENATTGVVYTTSGACHLRLFNSSLIDTGVLLHTNMSADSTLHPCQYGMEYDTNVFKATIVAEWSLVCNSAWQRGLAGSAFFIGRLIGAIIVSMFSDRYGRRYIFFSSVTIQAVLGVATSLSPSLWVFYCLYTLQGIFQNITYITAFVLGTEIMGPSYRKVTGLTMKISYSAGLVVLSGIAYLLRHWRHLEVAISIPMIFFLASARFLPESVPWLLSQGRKAEADVIIHKMAQINGVILPDDIVERVEIDEKKSSTSIKNICRHGYICRMALNMWFCITINTIVYYGLLLDTTHLHGDPYLNFAMGGAIEIPALLLTAAILDRVGRKPILMVAMAVGGTCLFINAFIPPDYYRTIMALSMTGRFTVTASYGVSYLMTAEIFPTVIRAAGVAIGNVTSRAGGILAPQIVVLGQLMSSGSIRPHYLLFGILSILASIFVIWLPEPTNKPLPQSFSDILIQRNPNVVAEEMEDLSTKCNKGDTMETDEPDLE